ncbi:1-deoxy-D-xylulose-5-phosphate reductoisomerase [Alcanivorax sp. 1008]|uniref:1-deoxy-D-xylulose-5-phosphate reductoisomerase n=1 Tax=Alcanivorax sp. 1008 TaxID=2816853 RepID=UPI001E08878B|nr:1-deoxy-D-xylulose-5-phosphate reductoisomerase [Alcanivorax sp. 1008]MCC1495550.1 1-deoxy-D-xylulose-5-phosphate reductoisomerase [Alcanivorax sp. 1008]
MQRVTVLGATGSIGVQTLDVLDRHPDQYQVFALAAFTRWQSLAELCLRHRPRYAVMREAAAAANLRSHLHAAGCDTEVLEGDRALEEIAESADTDVVVAAIVGAAGVRPTLAAVRAGKRVLLANKEALVVTGQLFMDAVRQHGAELIPLDSEHNAIFQCLPEAGRSLRGVRRLLLTASGGPFRNHSEEQLATVTVAEALNHPNWDMGPKISVDSATLMNKGLELIEASWLFAMDESLIDVVVHPQSVVHSMVEYDDGSVLAQMGTPDMRTPIACGLAWPQRVASGAPRLDFLSLSQLTFAAPDLQRFPCLRLAREALRAGGAASAVLNAANEVAVQAFIDQQLPFMAIPVCVEDALQHLSAVSCSGLEEIFAVDQRSRDHARAWIRQHGGVNH